MIDAKRILYGKPDSIPIVGIDQVQGNIDTLAVYYREGDSVKKVFRKNKYYIYTDTEQLFNLMTEGRDVPYVIANGPNKLNVILEPERYEHFKFLRSYLPSESITVSGAQAFMIQNEVNMFSGLDFDDVSRFYFDIEQISTGHFPDAENPDDHIVIISCLYTYKNETSEFLLRLDNYENEAELLKAFVKLVQLCDPDILLGYNCFVDTDKVWLANGRNLTFEELYNNTTYQQTSSVSHNKIKGDSAVVDSIKKVNKTKYNDIVYNIQTMYGRGVTSTPQHPHYGCRNGDIKYHMTGLYKEGDFLAVPIATVKPSPIVSTYTEDDYRFMGLMLADGHYNKLGGHFSNTNRTLIYWVFDYLESKGLSPRIKPVYRKVEHQNTMYVVHFRTLPLRNMFVDFGLNISNKSKKESRLDLSLVYNSSEDNIISFLSGLIDGDGHSGKNTVSIANVSISVIEWLERIISSLGLLGYHNDGDYHIVPTIPGLRVIEKLNCKTIKQFPVTNLETDRIPSRVVEYLYPFLRGKQGYSIETTKYGVYTGLSYDDFDLPRTTLNYILNGRNNPTRKQLFDIIQTIKNHLHKFSPKKRDLWHRQLNKINDILKYYWLPIKTIKKEKYDGYVYSITTEETGNYIVNGILTHNCFRYDMPVIQTRCKLFDVPFGIGRDGSEPYSFSTQIKFAEKETAYTNFNVHGRSCIDVYFLVMYYDVVARELPAHNLKDAAKHFGVAAENRVYIDGKDITEYWYTRRDELLEYAMDDVYETRALDKILGQSVFYSTQFVPLQHQDVARYGTGTKIEAIFTRAYINHKEAYPLPDPAEDYGGGLAYCPKPGYVEGPATYADVKSLYPWTRKALGIAPPKDTLGIYGPVMDLLNEERYRNKDLADQYEAEGNPLFESQNAKQNSYKIYINTGNYGFLGWEFTGFNYYEGARQITGAGQNILREMIRVSDENGYTIYRGDTDGVLAYVKDWEHLPEYYSFINTEVKKYVRELYGDEAADSFKITNDGSYEKGIIFDAKSYVLVDRKGKVKVKGNTLKSRSMEPFVKNTLNDMITKVLDKDTEGMCEVYYKEIDRIESGGLTFAEIRKRANLKMGRDEYLHKREAGRTHAIAAYEIAYTQEHEIPFRKGDPLEFYVKESGYEFVLYKNFNWKMRKIKRSVAELARVEKDFCGDYDKDYYLDRLNQGVKRLLPIFGIEEFSSYFPSIKLTKQDILKLEKHGTDDMADEESDINE